MSNFDTWLLDVVKGKNLDDDYNTNSPSYYDDLSRRNKLMKMLAEKIWQYDQELAKRFTEWDENLQNLPKDVERLLVQWMSDGTLDHIINDTIFSWKADQVDLDKTELNVQQRGLNLYEYAGQVTNNDWTSVMNEAITSLSTQGGGKLIIPQGTYLYSDDLHFKENVEVEGIAGVILKQNHPEARLIFYSKAVLRNVAVSIMNSCNQGAVFFSNEYLRRQSSEHAKPEGVKVLLDNIDFTTEFNPASVNKSVLNFYANRSDLAQAHGAGFARVHVINCSAVNFNIGTVINTASTGWVNGNKIQMSLTNFVHAVVANKSGDSLGVDYNDFVLYLQTSVNTRDIFIDNTGSSNIYDNCTIWDMETYTQAKIGNVILTGTKNGTAVPKERYHDFLRRNRYHLIGRFTRLTSLINHVLISVVSYENYRVDYYIRGGATPLVERRILGGSTRLDDSFDFYLNELENGQFELYIHNPANTEVEATFYIESYRSFKPSPLTVYESIGNAVKLNIANYYPDTSSRERVVLTTENDFNAMTPRSQFRYGTTYSKIDSSIPEAERGTPGNKAGLLTTHRIATSGSAFNYQEFRTFGSTVSTKLERYGNDSAFGWGDFLPVTP